MPKKIQIGSQIWTVELRNRKQDNTLTEDSFGYTMHRENLIIIDATASLSRQKQTLVHELFHAIRFTFGNPVTPKKSDDVDLWEHYFIAMYEEGFLLVLRDNPALITYLTKKEN